MVRKILNFRKVYILQNRPESWILEKYIYILINQPEKGSSMNNLVLIH
jgi:hypothetical protein